MTNSLSTDMGRKRQRKTRNYPLNLYSQDKQSGTYFFYRHPVTKKSFSLGSDRDVAIAAAMTLNKELIVYRDHVARILGVPDRSLSTLISKYRKSRLLDKNLADSTLELTNYRIDRLDRDLGQLSASNMSVMQVADYLDTNHKNDAYIKHRSLLIELFRYSITKGYRTDNPALVTYPKSYEKSRQRLTSEQFNAIYAIAEPWMRVAMLLSLVTLQGRSEICNIKYTDIRDGFLYVVRSKSSKKDHAYIKIRITSDIEHIISNSRLDRVLSPFVVHRVPERRVKAKNREHWTQLTLNDFSARFRELRDETGIFDAIDRNKRPTFHEIRSLGSWLYEQQGFETTYVQRLMTHADEKMTEYYQSGHEQKYIEVEANLSIFDALKTTV